MTLAPPEQPSVALAVVVLLPFLVLTPLQMRQLMQSLLDIRKQLSEAGWQIQDAGDINTGAAVKAVDPMAASNAGTAGSSGSGSSSGSGNTESMPDDVMLLLLKRESLIAAAQCQVLQSHHDKEGAVIWQIQWQLKQVSMIKQAH
jgi:hypothetical protein